MKLRAITAVTIIFAFMFSGCASTPSLNGSVNGLGEGKFRAYNTSYTKQGLTPMADNDMQLTCNRLGKITPIVVSQEESRKGEIKTGNKIVDTAVEYTRIGQMMDEKSSGNPYEMTTIFKCE